MFIVTFIINSLYSRVNIIIIELIFNVFFIFLGTHSNFRHDYVPLESTTDISTDESRIFNHRQTNKVRSIEETEAAHDLLSLSQSLPPLQGPGVVTIHQNLPLDDLPTPTSTSRPLTPETAKTGDGTIETTLPTPYYSSNVLYVVQVPTTISPKCTVVSDENPIYINETIQIEDQVDSNNDDIIILPLSPIEDNVVQDKSIEPPSNTNSTSKILKTKHVNSSIGSEKRVRDKERKTYSRTRIKKPVTVPTPTVNKFFNHFKK